VFKRVWIKKIHEHVLCLVVAVLLTQLLETLQFPAQELFHVSALYGVSTFTINQLWNALGIPD
jgi:hypothetical protein